MKVDLNRVLFLDFDGVLNSGDWIKRGNSPSARCPLGSCCNLQPDLVARLNIIVAATGCQVVYSTAWRTGGKEPLERCWASLQCAGATFPMPTDATTDMAQAVHEGQSGSLLIAPSRGKEIGEWLQSYWSIGGMLSPFRYVILDDSSDAECKRFAGHGKFVQTSAEWGLTERHMESAILWLLGAA
ncbi:HAD domain-containing protein [Armatimonas sp.]|uniref:HAD domain-containing protein n=1 Tax=Armatimonas sp. TaxID=1872638 RepID=UPI00374D1461